MDLYLSIVVPLYNEEESVTDLVQRVVQASKEFDFSFEIILVDDGSTDATWQIIESLKKTNPRLRGIKLRRNFGQTGAMVAGFDHARGDIIITMDGDLQNDPADIPLLLGKINQGYDIVSGWRVHRMDPYYEGFSVEGCQFHDIPYHGCSPSRLWMLSKSLPGRVHKIPKSLW